MQMEERKHMRSNKDRQAQIRLYPKRLEEKPEHTKFRKKLANSKNK